MKNLFTLSLFLFAISASLFLPQQASAQPPQAFKYQAVVRDNTGEILQNQAVGIRMSIHDETAAGNIVYQETFTETTNGFGLVNIKIGNGITTIGIFTHIHWEINSKFLEIEIDPANGTNYVSMGTSELLSVPYSLYSEHSSLVSNKGTGNIYVGKDAAEISSGNANAYIGFESGKKNTSGNYNAFFGCRSGYNNTTGHNNTFMSYLSGYSNTIGNYNAFIGNESGYNNTEGYNNTFIGNESGYSNTTGYINSFLGFQSGYNNTEGAANTFIGNASGFNNTTGGLNTFIGDRSGNANTEGEKNTYLGYKSGYTNLTGSENVSLGYKALYYNTGDKNTATGFAALYKNSYGSENTANGYGALYLNTFGHNNVAVGTMALYSNTTGYDNTANGYQSLYNNTTGKYNTANGYNALYSNSTGDENTAIGVDAFFTTTNIYNTTCLGYFSGAISNVSNRIEIGNPSVSWIGGQVTWSTYSDRRIKTNIQENVAGLDFIKSLRPVTYNLDIHQQNEMIKRDGKGKEEGDWPEKYDIENMEMTGFIAQEVEEAAKSAGYDFSGVRKAKDDLGMYSISYAQFVVPLVKAVQEQQEMMEEQQTIIEKLKLRIEELEKSK